MLVGVVGLVVVEAGVVVEADVAPELVAVVPLGLVGTLTVVGLGFETDAGALWEPFPEEALLPPPAAPWVEAGWRT